jgi:diguanylate cyclase (GGDEF)-like protein
MLRSSLATKLLVLSLIPAASVLVAWIGISRSFSSSDRAEAQVSRAIAALELANDVAGLANEAILEERGFLVTGGEGFAEPYYNAVGTFSARVGELERLFVDSPERREEVRALAAVFQRWQEKVAVPAIAARRRNETGESAALVASAGRQLSNEINALSKQLTRQQGAVVRERLDESGRMRASATRWALIVVALTTGLAVAGGVIFTLQLRNRLALLEDAAEGIARGDFQGPAFATGNDEIARLARSFNAMAEQVRERTREAAGLRKLSELLQACGTVAEAFEVTGRVVPSLLPGSRGVIQIINSSRSQLEVVARFGLPGDPEPAPITEPSSPNDCWGFRRGVAHRFTPEDATVGCRHPGAEDTYLCVPMLAHGEALGVLTLSPAPDEAQATRAERFAEQIGLAVANLRLRDSLRTQAVRDGLTGLYNRRYFEEAAERELSRAKRYRRSLVFMVLDVDHFKRFNDTHGHDAGDLLLREVGQLLRSSVRQSDVACRYGGEEFVLIMPESSPDEALRRADQIRESFHRLGLSHQGKVLGSVTVSIGIAAYPDHGRDRDAIVRNADAALYRAKREGRDRALIAPPNELSMTDPPRSSARTTTGAS